MHVRCPHCHQPVELVENAGLEHIDCPSCSHFSLLGDQTASYHAGHRPQWTQFAKRRDSDLPSRFGLADEPNLSDLTAPAVSTSAGLSKPAQRQFAIGGRRGRDIEFERFGRVGFLYQLMNFLSIRLEPDPDMVTIVGIDGAGGGIWTRRRAPGNGVQGERHRDSGRNSSRPSASRDGYRNPQATTGENRGPRRNPFLGPDAAGGPDRPDRRRNRRARDRCGSRSSRSCGGDLSRLSVFALHRNGAPEPVAAIERRIQSVLRRSPPPLTFVALAAQLHADTLVQRLSQFVDSRAAIF